MQVRQGLNEIHQLPAGAAVCIGNFDGLHRGHQHILDIARGLRESSQASALVVITFEPHPLTVLRPAQAPPRLSPWPVKRGLLERAGVDAAVILQPAPDVLGLSADRFWQIIRDDVKARHLVEGASFRFGKGAAGTIDLLKKWSIGTDVMVHVADSVIAPLLNLLATPVSSSLVRFLVANGRVRDAAICLGRPFGLMGTVVKGYERGRLIGVPTANLNAGEQMSPADGVYAARCDVDGTIYPVALSIGNAPTFGPSRRQIEGHLIGFSGDLYGRTIQFDLIDWIRDQWKFTSVEKLKEQIARDMEAVNRIAAVDPSRAIAQV